MAKFSDAFLQGLRGSGQRGSPTDPALQRADQYGSSNPLAKSIGGMFGMQMDTGQELAAKETSAITEKPGSVEHLKKVLLTQAKYAAPKEQATIFAKITELEQMQAEQQKTNASNALKAQREANDETRKAAVEARAAQGDERAITSLALEKERNIALADDVLLKGDQYKSLSDAIRNGSSAAIDAGTKIVTPDPTVDKPDIVISQDNEGNWVLINKTTKTVVGRGTTKSEAELQRDALAKQERENNNKRLALTTSARMDGLISSVELQLTEFEKNNPQIAATKNYLTQGLPGSDAAILKNQIISLKSQLGLDALATLKKLSSTGASGLGATNQMEIEMLQSEIASLDILLPSELPAAFERIRTHTKVVNDLILGVPPKIDWGSSMYSRYTKNVKDPAGGPDVLIYSLDNGKTYFTADGDVPVK